MDEMATIGIFEQKALQRLSLGRTNSDASFNTTREVSRMGIDKIYESVLSDDQSHGRSQGRFSSSPTRRNKSLLYNRAVKPKYTEE